MLKKSSAYKKVVLSVTACMLVQTVGGATVQVANAADLGVQNVQADNTEQLKDAVTTSSAVQVPNNDQLSKNDVVVDKTTGQALTLDEKYLTTKMNIDESKIGKIQFPSETTPGRANAEVTESKFTLENNVLSVAFAKTDAGITLDSFDDKISNEKYNISTNSLFSMVLTDGTKVSASDMTIAVEPTLFDLAGDKDAIRLVDREHGKAIKTLFNYNKNGIEFNVEWSVILRNNSNNIKQEFKFEAIKGDLNIDSTKLIDMKCTDKNAVKMNKDDGSPLTIGNIFMGIENPLAKVNISGDEFDVIIKSNVPIESNSSRIYSTGIGIAPQGQMSRAFKYYLERERSHFRRPELMYNTWWTFKMNSVLEENALNDAFKMYQKELTEKRGININAFQIDDGWDDTKGNPVWSMNTKTLPNGFEPFKETVQGSGGDLGVWMSPFGGYPPTRGERTTANYGNYDLRPYDNDPQYGDEQNLKEWGMFTLSDQRYYDRFKEATFSMIDNQGVKCFKFDGVGDGLRNSGPSDPNYKEYEKLLELTDEIRGHEPDVFIYATVGTWASPYWLWYVDSVWRDEDDQGVSGEGTGLETTGVQDRERWINYRDAAIFKHHVTENPMSTINELMTHGFTYSEFANYKFNNDLTQEYVRTSILNDMKMLYALGGSLGEMHVQESIMKNLSKDQQDFIWDNLAKNIKWSQANFKLLSDNHWVGGNPNEGEVYGYSSWSEDKSILTLRNPSKEEKTFEIDPVKTLNAPEGFEQDYVFVERDGARQPIRIKKGESSKITLKPFEVLIFEAGKNSSNSRPSNSHHHNNNHNNNNSSNRDDVKNEDNKTIENGNSSHKNQWVTVNGNKMYSDEHGNIVKNNWIKDAVSGNWHFLKEDGTIKTGWLKNNEKWYFLDTASGAMKTGWVNYNGNWYFTDNSGAMQSGWINDNGTWYYCDSSGTMLSNTSVNGYKLGHNGAWIK